MTSTNRKISFFIMNEKGFCCLQNALSHFSADVIDCVVSEKDGGLLDDSYDKICDLCATHNIKLFGRDQVKRVKANFVIAAGWRWIINHSGVVAVLHDSLLPRYRGFSPLVTALINGEAEIGVTAFLASQEYDKGPILVQKSLPIRYPITIQEAIRRICPLYEEIARCLVRKILEGDDLTGEPQDETKASYSLWRDEWDYQIDWIKSAREISRFVDSVGFPYFGAVTQLKGRKIRILKVEEVADVRIENRQPGKIIFNHSGFPVVVCGDGLIKITRALDLSSNRELLPFSVIRERFY